MKVLIVKEEGLIYAAELPEEPKRVIILEEDWTDSLLVEWNMYSRRLEAAKESAILCADQEKAIELIYDSLNNNGKPIWSGWINMFKKNAIPKVYLIPDLDWEVSVYNHINIHNLHGKFVTVTNQTINFGYNHDSEQASKYLEVGKRYKVVETHVSDFTTSVWLREFPGLAFNSVHFVLADPKPVAILKESTLSTEQESQEEDGLDLANAQFIGFQQGKQNDIITLVKAMGLTRSQWNRWKKYYPVTPLTHNEMLEIDEYFYLQTK